MEVIWPQAHHGHLRQRGAQIRREGVAAPTPFGVRQCGHTSGVPTPSVNGPSSQGVLQGFDQIACVHMSGLSVRSHMSAGQDGFRDTGSKRHGGLVEGHRSRRSVPRRGLIGRTICSSSCKVWHRLSTVAVQVLPVSGLSLGRAGHSGGRRRCGVGLACQHQLPLTAYKNLVPLIGRRIKADVIRSTGAKSFAWSPPCRPAPAAVGHAEAPARPAAPELALPGVARFGGVERVLFTLGCLNTSEHPATLQVTSVQHANATLTAITLRFA